MRTQRQTKETDLDLPPIDPKISPESSQTPYLSPLKKYILLSPVYERAASNEQSREPASWYDGNVTAINKYAKTTTNFLITKIPLKTEKEFF